MRECHEHRGPQLVLDRFQASDLLESRRARHGRRRAHARQSDGAMLLPYNLGLLLPFDALDGVLDHDGRQGRRHGEHETHDRPTHKAPSTLGRFGGHGTDGGTGPSRSGGERRSLSTQFSDAALDPPRAAMAPGMMMRCGRHEAFFFLEKTIKGVQQRQVWRESAGRSKCRRRRRLPLLPPLWQKFGAPLNAASTPRRGRC